MDSTSTIDRDALASHWLPKAEAYLISTAGREYAENAGFALTQCLDAYKPADGDFGDYLFLRLKRLAANQVREFLGKPGSAKHAGRHATHSINYDDGDTEELPTMEGNPESIHTHAGEMVRVMQFIDKRDTGRDRWTMLGKVAGDMSEDDVARCIADGPTFEHMYEFMDALILFGAALSQTPSKMVRLSISRTKSQFRSLVWAIIQLEKHGIRMTYTGGEDTADSKAIFKSKAQPFLIYPHRRWYPFDTTKRTTPWGINLTESSLAYWLLFGMTRRTHADARIRLVAPGLGKDLAEEYASAVKALTTWDVGVEPSRSDPQFFMLTVPGSPYVEKWLERFVPACIWKDGE